MKPSKGGPIPVGSCATADHALILLDKIHHWSATKVNREGGIPGYLVKLRHGGREADARAGSFVMAVNRALDKLRSKQVCGPTLRLVGRGRST